MGRPGQSRACRGPRLASSRPLGAAENPPCRAPDCRAAGFGIRLAWAVQPRRLDARLAEDLRDGLFCPAQDVGRNGRLIAYPYSDCQRYFLDLRLAAEAACRHPCRRNHQFLSIHGRDAKAGLNRGHENENEGYNSSN